MTATDLVPLPAVGRRYEATRTIRLGDVGIDGRLRLDALARFLQDVAADDAAEVGLREATWVVRRTVFDVQSRPRFGDRIALTTFCGGIGSRWAERRTSVRGPDATIETSTVWVHIDAESGRPAPLPPLFLDAYAEAAGGRVVSTRLGHPPPPTDAERTPWPLRTTDFDVLGHVNNAVYWSAVEETARPAGRIELEYRLPIGPGVAVERLVSGDGMWLVSAAGVHASAQLSPPRPPPS